MDCNERHRHGRDGALCFDADSHTYTVDGLVYDSVTTVVERCFEQFDAEYWAARKAETTGRDAAEILAEWSRKGEEARNLGTEMHARIESYYLGQPVDPEWMFDGAFRHFAAFATDIRLCPFRTEWRIFHEESRLAGTLDFLALNAGRLEIWDWKRSAKVVNCYGLPIDVNSFGRTALEPIQHIPDTTFHHYALQVSVYRYILEEKYGLEISAAHLGVFHPDYQRYFTVDLPYLRDEVRTLLEWRQSQFTDEP